MKDDMISRQAVIESIQECADAAHRNHEWDMEQGYRNAIECVEEAPSAQPGWIPVAERLPKKDGDYLVTTHSGQIARYIFIGGSSEEYWRRCATAWMPLPTPYREGGQDGNK